MAEENKKDSSKGAFPCIPCLACLTVIAPVIVIFVILALASNSGNDTQLSGYYKQVGEEAKIYLAETAYIYAAIDKTSGEQLNKRLLAKNYTGVTEMELSGNIFRVENDTKVKILDAVALSGLYEVRILEGKNMGQSAWVMNAFVK